MYIYIKKTLFLKSGAKIRKIFEICKFFCVFFAPKVIMVGRRKEEGGCRGRNNARMIKY